MGFRMWGTHVYLWPIQADAWPKKKYNIVIILLKIINFKKLNIKNKAAGFYLRFCVLYLNLFSLFTERLASDKISINYLSVSKTTKA